MITTAELKVKSPDMPYELIKACQKGDQRAQLQVYRLYYKTMYNISLRILNNPVEAEDIMQESFLDAFEEIGKYSLTESFEKWLNRFLEKRLMSVISCK